MKNDKFARDMARLEEARLRTHQRMAKQQQRIDERFARMQQQLERTFGTPSNTQQRIIEASLDLLKEDGLANVTQRKVATRLDMQAPALYWHFKNKEILVDYMAEAILQKEFSDLKPKDATQSWQDWLTEHMVRLRKAMLAYPDGARVVAGAHWHPAVTLAKSLECGLISLQAGGIDLQAARQIMMTATSYTFGYVIEEQSGPTEQELADIDLDAFLEPYPQMTKSLEDLGHGPEARDRDYMAGLQYIVAGAATNSTTT